MKYIEACDRMESGSCRGCNVLSILRETISTKADVDREAQRISDEYCPAESGGIDGQTLAVIYNYTPDGHRGVKSVW